MSGAKQKSIKDGDEVFDLSHLDPIDLYEQLDGRAITVRCTFWPHTYSDEKAKGVPIGRDRYFCRERWSVSHEVAHFMASGQFSRGHVRVFLSGKRKEQQFYTLDLGHIAVFCAIQKDEHAEDTINCKVISCYPTNGSTIHKLPKGKLYSVEVVYRRRLAGATIHL